MREIVGDPLTGQLPATRLIVPQDTYGPVNSKKKAEQWPRVADPQMYTMNQLMPGRIISVRTMRGVRTWQVRTVCRSFERRNKGRHYVTAMDRHGFCHSAWVDRIISVTTVERALSAGKALKAIGPGR